MEEEEKMVEWKVFNSGGKIKCATFAVMKKTIPCLTFQNCDFRPKSKRTRWHFPNRDTLSWSQNIRRHHKSSNRFEIFRTLPIHFSKIFFFHYLFGAIEKSRNKSPSSLVLLSIQVPAWTAEHCWTLTCDCLGAGVLMAWGQISLLQSLVTKNHHILVTY